MIWSGLWIIVIYAHGVICHLKDLKISIYVGIVFRHIWKDCCNMELVIIGFIFIGVLVVIKCSMDNKARDKRLTELEHRCGVLRTRVNRLDSEYSKGESNG